MLWLLQIIVALAISASGAPGTIDGQITVRRKDGADKMDYSDVVVYVADVAAPVHDARAAIRQANLQFSPKVLVVAAGTKVAFPNDDLVEHNIFSHSANADFDLGRFGLGPGKTWRFLTVGVAEIFCNAHRGMVSYVVVAPSKAFAITGPDDTFRIKQVPAGRHRLVIWGRFGRPRSVEAWVNVPPGGLARFAFELKEQVEDDPPHKNKSGVDYGAGYR